VADHKQSQQLSIIINVFIPMHMVILFSVEIGTCFLLL
jgi:hypothetical protein